jgi:hypothetical protein
MTLLLGEVDQEGASLHPVREVGGIAGSQESATIEQEEAVAPLGLVEIGGAPDDGDARARHRPYDAPQFAPGRRVDAGARFVEQQQLRPRQQGTGEPELLLHATRELPRQPAREGRKAGELQQRREALAARCRIQIVQVCLQVQVLLHRQVLVEPEALRHVANLAAHRVAVGDSVAKDLQRPRVRREQAGDESQQRRLSRSVRADETGDLARRDAGRHIRQGRPWCRSSSPGSKG